MVMPVKYHVRLQEADRQRLEGLTRSGSHPVRVVARARALLELDENHGPVDHRSVIGGRVGLCENTVNRIAQKFAGCPDVDKVIVAKERATAPVAPKATGEVEARLIALASSTPPAGYSQWSLRLMERHVLLMEGMPALDHTTIGRVLKRGLSARI